MRRCRGVVVAVCLALVTLFLVLTSKLVLVSEDASYEEGFSVVEGYSYRMDGSWETEIGTVSRTTETLKTQRHVTPSLAELGARGSTPRSSKHVLMVTRVPGAGAELLVLVLQKLQGYNVFKHIRLPPGDEGALSTLQQELLVEEVTSIIRQEAIPLSFDGDVRFLNFTEFGRPAPTYISLIRDPLDPKTLHWLKTGASGTIYRGSIAHFCGHDERCSERNNVWALEQAKANVIRWYPIVGVLDRMEETVGRLEKAYPYFFEGASIIYDKLRPKKQYNNGRATMKPKAKKRLEELFKTEIEFYEWTKWRLLNTTAENG
ncbi:heparan sulfate 2-O-sulfotransferase 1-like [Copidosoma floridanum]|uniref:heparan sulfate 2-O-sulfotransferase 1-like n=1 Tax=Copidosoma floridanum TaxID=29053 RepID=UPI0006C951A6|nr:heparan sulfate 2-O-sulfotransferase 1-like [Copidosoma floridanum]